MPMRLIGALAILAAALASPAGAEPVDRLFGQQQLALLEPGAALTYRHVRQIHAKGAARPGFDEVIRVERDAANAPVLVTMNARSAPRRLDPFRGMTGNPVLMVFLESMVAVISETTGGSPFYLRNRIREAMRERMTERPVSVSHAGSEIAAWELELRPFESDPHVEELGAFKDLRLSFVLSDSAPGAFLSLAATTDGEPAAYSEEIRLDETP
ncbi:MAG TPA: hypothetical protein VFJ13_11125 [Paracoccaceae bacterium]|nr:hypothetical protein [Paracoccaceae bacterium]